MEVCERCGTTYIPDTAIGQWDCWMHPGRIVAGTWTCCGFRPSACVEPQWLPTPKHRRDWDPSLPAFYEAPPLPPPSRRQVMGCRRADHGLPDNPAPVGLFPSYLIADAHRKAMVETGSLALETMDRGELYEWVDEAPNDSAMDAQTRGLFAAWRTIATRAQLETSARVMAINAMTDVMFLAGPIDATAPWARTRRAKRAFNRMCNRHDAADVNEPASEDRMEEFEDDMHAMSQRIRVATIEQLRTVEEEFMRNMSDAFPAADGDRTRNVPIFGGVSVVWRYDPRVDASMPEFYAPEEGRRDLLEGRRRPRYEPVDKPPKHVVDEEPGRAPPLAPLPVHDDDDDDDGGDSGSGSDAKGWVMPSEYALNVVVIKIRELVARLLADAPPVSSSASVPSPSNPVAQSGPPPPSPPPPPRSPQLPKQPTGDDGSELATTIYHFVIRQIPDAVSSPFIRLQIAQELSRGFNEVSEMLAIGVKHNTNDLLPKATTTGLLWVETLYPTLGGTPAERKLVVDRLVGEFLLLVEALKRVANAHEETTDEQAHKIHPAKEAVTSPRSTHSKDDSTLEKAETEVAEVAAKVEKINKRLKEAEDAVTVAAANFNNATNKDTEKDAEIQLFAAKTNRSEALDKARAASEIHASADEEVKRLKQMAKKASESTEAKAAEEAMKVNEAEKERADAEAAVLQAAKMENAKRKEDKETKDNQIREAREKDATEKEDERQAKMVAYIASLPKLTKEQQHEADEKRKARDAKTAKHIRANHSDVVAELTRTLNQKKKKKEKKEKDAPSVHQQELPPEKVAVQPPPPANAKKAEDDRKAKEEEEEKRMIAEFNKSKEARAIEHNEEPSEEGYHSDDPALDESKYIPPVERIRTEEEKVRDRLDAANLAVGNAEREFGAASDKYTVARNAWIDAKNIRADREAIEQLLMVMNETHAAAEIALEARTNANRRLWEAQAAMSTWTKRTPLPLSPPSSSGPAGPPPRPSSSSPTPHPDDVFDYLAPHAEGEKTEKKKDGAEARKNRRERRQAAAQYSLDEANSRVAKARDSLEAVTKEYNASSMAIVTAYHGGEGQEAVDAAMARSKELERKQQDAKSELMNAEDALRKLSTSGTSKSPSIYSLPSSSSSSGPSGPPPQPSSSYSVAPSQLKYDPDEDRFGT